MYDSFEDYDIFLLDEPLPSIVLSITCQIVSAILELL